MLAGLLTVQCVAAAGQGCKATCEEGSVFTVQGVEDIVLASKNGQEVLSVKNEFETIARNLASSVSAVRAQFGDVNATLQKNVDETVTSTNTKLDFLLYEDARKRINANRLLIRQERQALVDHLDCGMQGRVWSKELGRCMPLLTRTCGPLPIAGLHRAKVLHDCIGVIGTECKTSCAAGWYGEEVTYVCTGAVDLQGGWKRIEAHGNRLQMCFNVDECSLPDYPCNDRSFMCTDTEGSFSCACHSSMVESADKQRCECPTETHWMLQAGALGSPLQTDTPFPYCTCPYFSSSVTYMNDAVTVDNAEGECRCPSGTYQSEEVPVTEPLPGRVDAYYPDIGTGVLNRNDRNLVGPCLTKIGPEIEFEFTGEEQEWTVPDDVTSFTAHMWGGAGATTGSGTCGRYGGGGGYATGKISVAPGETLKIIVGGNGVGCYDLKNLGHSNNARTHAAGGGGLSGIFLNDFTHANSIMIAGGGGGAGSGGDCNNRYAGGGGGTTGNIGQPNLNSQGGVGTQSGGGVSKKGTKNNNGDFVGCLGNHDGGELQGGAGVGCKQGSAQAFGGGGVSGTKTGSNGGGGGGGYYGGGGGGGGGGVTNGGGGGGGSGYLNTPGRVSDGSMETANGADTPQRNNPHYKNDAGYAPRDDVSYCPKEGTDDKKWPDDVGKSKTGGNTFQKLHEPETNRNARCNDWTKNKNHGKGYVIFSSFTTPASHPAWAGG